MGTFVREILFPTDFSENARHALPFVLDLARRSGARLHLFHSIENPYELAPLQEDVKNRTARKVKYLLQDLKQEILQDEQNKELEIETDTIGGQTMFSILQKVDDNDDIDLIVMGTKGASGLKKMLFGSITSEVILHSTVPVLAIPEHIPTPPPTNIIYATDYRDGDLQSIEQLTGWAGLYNAILKVVHVAPNLKLTQDIKFRGFRDLCEERISYKKIDYDLVVENNFHAGITTYLEQNPGSILAMTRYTKQLFSSLFRKSHSKDFSCYTKVPLLVIIGEEAL